MKVDKRMGRRRFLQDSTALVGAGSLLGGPSQPAPTAALDTSAENLKARESYLQMLARFEPTQTVWIMVGPESGFKEQLASRELARGLRNLGLAHAPIEAERGTAEPSASDFVFRLEVNGQAFQHPDAYEIIQEKETDKAPRARLTGSTPRRFSTRSPTSWSARVRFSAWTERFIR